MYPSPKGGFSPAFFSRLATIAACVLINLKYGFAIGWTVYPCQIVYFKRISQNDETAVEECLSEYGGLVWSLAKRFCRDDSEAEDATQEIFLEIWKNAHKYDPAISAESTFISMLARRRLIDRVRKNSRSLDTVPIEPDINVPQEVDRDQLELADEAARATKCLSQLKPEERRVLELSVYQQLSQSKIADVLNLPLGTVKTHARRGLMRLRELLREEEPSGGIR